MTLWHENLRRLIALVERLDAEAVAKAGPSPAAGAGDWMEWHRGLRSAYGAVSAQLADEENARISERGDCTTLLMAGIRSSSTGGFSGALRNWQRAAEKKIGGAS